MGVARADRELEEFEWVFKALAHKTRRHILTTLNANNGQMKAGKIAGDLAYSWPTITRHLRQLEHANLVSVEVQGREHLYSLNTAHLKRVTNNYLKWFE